MTTIGIAAAAAAGTVAYAAYRAGWLGTSGAVAAALIGWVAIVAGLRWAILLITYFVATSLLSGWRRKQKGDRAGDVVQKGGTRDGWQVGANGGAFAIAALGAVLLPGSSAWIRIGAGALAASAADSWGTEVGVLATHPPRSVLTWRPVPTGTSGGITGIGSLASIGGAAFIAGTSAILGWSPSIARSVLLGGVVGALADSVMGAAAQARRWCPTCQSETEQVRHRCGTETLHHRGFVWLNNDLVNLMATLVGAAVALAA